MDILITDITRMQNQHICVAGIERNTKKRVRPVINGQLPSSLLVSNGGPVDFRRVLRFPRVRPCGANPEVEDVLVNFDEIEVLGRVSPDRFIEILSANARDDLSSIGPSLVQENRSLKTPEGEGDCSLVLTRAPKGIDLYLNSVGKLRFNYLFGTDLSVTDVRPYEADLATPAPAAFSWLKQELRKDLDVFLCLGLTRPYRGFHWLQLNSIHFASSASWTIASAPWN